MGGAVAGGAIGGNIMDSAPAVPEYKENRGYLAAFERAKQASDRLDNLDDTEFKLTYEKAQRDEERAYREQQSAIERQFKIQQDELTRQWNAEQQRLNREWQAAVAEKNFERQAELKREMFDLEKNFKFEYQRIANAQETEIQELRKDIVSFQNGGALVPVGLKDGTALKIPKSYYYDMQDYFIGSDWNGEPVTEKTVKSYIKNHPKEVRAYLKMFGLGSETETSGTETKSGSKTTGQDFSSTMKTSRIPGLYWNWGAQTGAEDEDGNEELTDEDKALFESLGITING
jgi:hypothetical protein